MEIIATHYKVEHKGKPLNHVDIIMNRLERIGAKKVAFPVIGAMGTELEELEKLKFRVKLAERLEEKNIEPVIIESLEERGILTSLQHLFQTSEALSLNLTRKDVRMFSEVMNQGSNDFLNFINRTAKKFEEHGLISTEELKDSNLFPTNILNEADILFKKIATRAQMRKKATSKNLTGRLAQAVPFLAVKIVADEAREQGADAMICPTIHAAHLQYLEPDTKVNYLHDFNVFPQHHIHQEVRRELIRSSTSLRLPLELLEEALGE